MNLSISAAISDFESTGKIVSSLSNPLPIAQLTNLSKSFTRQLAINEVDLTVYPGEVLAILGPNGAGKTTLINMMLGRLSPTSGRIKIFGYSPADLKLKRLCGAMLQVAGLPDTLKVKELVVLFQSYYPNSMDYFEISTLAGLNEFENKFCRQLSGGQKQRLLFALAICGNPKLLFLDEPSVGMDLSARKKLWQAIRCMKEKGTSIILTTHYLEEADQLADRIVMLNKGRIVQNGTPEVIKSQFDCKTIQFKSDISKQILNGFRDIVSIENRQNSIILRTKNPIAVLKQLFDATSEITDLTVTSAALEEAFLNLNSTQEQGA